MVKYHIYRKVARSNSSPLEAHVGIYRLLLKGIVNTRNCTIPKLV